MKIYLVQNYKRSTNTFSEEPDHVWAEAQAFMTMKLAMEALAKLKDASPSADAEIQEVEVTKRVYNKREVVGLDASANTTAIQ